MRKIEISDELARGKFATNVLHVRTREEANQWKSYVVSSVESIELLPVGEDGVACRSRRGSQSTSEATKTEGDATLD